MRNLLEYILKNITLHPESVEITQENEEGAVYLKVRVHKEDMPIVIGKNGKVIRALRNLIKTAARKQNLWVNLELLES